MALAELAWGQIMVSEKKYDVALSFAGEDRHYAKQLADALLTRGIKVFYDEYEKANLWGRDLYTHLSEIYQNEARYVVMFISHHYAAKLWTGHERKSAQARALREPKEYILPIRLDNVDVEGVLQTICYLSWQRENAESIADIIRDKLHRLVSRDRRTTSFIGTPEELYFRVKEIIIDELGVEEWEVTPTAHFIDDLEADSLNLVDLVMRFEEEFSIEIPDEEAVKLLTLIDVYKYLEGKVLIGRQTKRQQNQFPFKP
jgi:acyl carrier protein